MSALAALLLSAGSSGKHASDDVLMAKSVSNLESNECKKVSVPYRAFISTRIMQEMSCIPLNSRLRSKFVRFSNIRLNCAPDTMLSICKCRYSRCERVFLGEYQIRSVLPSEQTHSPRLLVLPN